jgi:hypothetical protein
MKTLMFFVFLILMASASPRCSEQAFSPYELLGLMDALAEKCIDRDPEKVKRYKIAFMRVFMNATDADAENWPEVEASLREDMKGASGDKRRRQYLASRDAVKADLESSFDSSFKAMCQMGKELR